MADSVSADDRTASIRRLRMDIVERLDAIAKLYKDAVKITLIVRVPSKPDGSRDTVMTDDDPEKAITALRSLYGDPASERYAND